MSNLSQFAASGDPQYWVSGATYALGKTVRSPTDHQRYVRVVGGAGTTDPANDATNWRPDGGRPIKSIQRGELIIANSATSGTATISAVNTSKSELRYLGGLVNNGGAGGVRITLTNSTTITAVAIFSASSNTPISWELTEYH